MDRIQHKLLATSSNFWRQKQGHCQAKVCAHGQDRAARGRRWRFGSMVQETGRRTICYYLYIHTVVFSLLVKFKPKRFRLTFDVSILICCRCCHITGARPGTSLRMDLNRGSWLFMKWTVWTLMIFRQALFLERNGQRRSLEAQRFSTPRRGPYFTRRVRQKRSWHGSKIPQWEQIPHWGDKISQGCFISSK